MKAEGKKKNTTKAPLKRNVRLLNTEVLNDLKFCDRITVSDLAMIHLLAPEDFYIISNFGDFFLSRLTINISTLYSTLKSNNNKDSKVVLTNIS